VSSETIFDRASYPFGQRTTRPLERAVLVALIGATATGIALALLSPGAIGTLIALVLATGGAVVALRYPTPGLAALLSSPIVASLTGVDASVGVLIFSMVAMGAFLLTLRGAHSRFVAPLAAASAYVGMSLTEGTGFLAGSALAALAVTFAAAVSGAAIREHFRFLHSLEERAAEAVVIRDAERQRRVTAERLSIARDLHDVVGHQVAVVNMQISMAEVSLPPSAETPRAALRAARDGVRSILHESQRILTVLRDGRENDDLSPTPSLDGIGELLASYRAIGATIESTIDIPGADMIEPGVGATAYRMLQEALTNAHRYGTGTITVALSADENRFLLEIRNLVASSAPDERTGYGLIGMWERAQSVGGDLEVGERDGYFVVTASLPFSGRMGA
jgi:signal transduction histidine kinase